LLLLLALQAATAGDLLSREKLLLCLFISAGTEAGINDCCN
jgi:hypothetical protein